MYFTEEKSFQQVIEKVKKQQLIVAAGVDSSEHEKICNEAGCDLILLYPTARYQHALNRFLTGFLAFGNSNELMEEMAAEVMPLMNSPFLFAGLNGSDPFKNDRILLEKMKNFGFIGIHNYPTMTLVDETFGMNMDKLKSGLDKEIDLFKKASKMGFYTCGMATDKKQALQLVRANVDMLILYLGLGEKTESRNQRQKSRIYQNIRKLKDLTGAIRNIAPDLPILFFDETLTTIDEIKTVIQEVKEINGYLLLPIIQKEISSRQLQLEIEQLKTFRY